MTEPLPGEALHRGRYRLDEVLGSGGLSTVYRARDLVLNRDVAIKVFTARARNPGDLHAQEAEARLLASFNHHNLITLLDAGVNDAADPQIFLVMELVQGTDLRRRLKDGPLPATEVAHLAFDVAEAIEYVHGRGVVHRDVKPANVLLVGYGTAGRPRVKLADFGLATLLGVSSLVDEEYVAGTAAYLSPEQAEGAEPGPPTDVYSLGLVLLEALTGRLEFPGDVRTSAFARLERDPVIPPELPAAWRRVLAAMIARRPADRPTLGDLVLAFRRIVIEADQAARPGAGAAPASARIAAVRRYELADPSSDRVVADVVSLAARILEVPLVAVALVDDTRAWLKARYGDVELAPGDPAPLLAPRPRVITDSERSDGERTAVQTHPLLRGTPTARSCATAPLLTVDGHVLGSLAVLDTVPRAFTEDAIRSLEDLAAMIVHEFEIRVAVRRIAFPAASPDPA